MSIIKNRKSLSTSKAKKIALSIAEEGIKAVLPKNLLYNKVMKKITLKPYEFLWII